MCDSETVRMPENTDLLKAQTRPPDQVKRLFDAFLLEAGDRQYKIEILKAELREINQKLFTLGKEYQRGLEIYPEPKEV